MSALQIISSADALAEGVALDVMGSTDLNEGAPISIRFTTGPAVIGKVIKLEKSDTRAVIEVDRNRWWLYRRDVMNIDGALMYPWAVGGPET